MKRLLGSLLVAGVAGCAHTTPPQRMASVAGKLGSYREWKNANPCKGDARVMRKDLDSMNVLLSEFLTQTGMGVEGAWSPEQLAILDAGQTELPPALDALAKTIAALKKCKVDKSLSGPLQKADENVRNARQRVSEAPSIIPLVKAKIVLTKWRAEQAEAIKSSREQWCGGSVKPGSVPDIFYAAEDETGKTEWHFCNDVKVVTDTGSRPLVVDPESRSKRAEHKKYIEAVAKYPPSEVQKAPKVDLKTIMSDSKPAEAKPAETKPAETKPAETKPVEAKPAETKPVEAKPAEAKPAEAKPAETKPVDRKPAEPKPTETKPTPAKHGDTKRSDAKPAEEPKPSERSDDPFGDDKPAHGSKHGESGDLRPED